MGAIILLVLGLFGNFGGMAQILVQPMTSNWYSVGYLVWWDKGSGADRDFSCRSAYQMNVLFTKPGNSFTLTAFPHNNDFIVGHNGQSSYNEFMDTQSFTLRNYWDPYALDVPIGFKIIWNDRGSGADLDGTIVRPLCRAGYVSIGDVMYQGHADPPPVELYNNVRCVAQTYTRQCAFGPEIWADHGSGADRDVKVLSIRCNHPGLLTTDFFYASGDYGADPDTTPYAVKR